MAYSSSISLLLTLLISLIVIRHSLAANTDRNVSLGSTLYANNNSSWTSPSGDFAFGFRPVPDRADQFVLAVWYAKIPSKTVVWFADANYPLLPGSKVELTSAGNLVIQDAGGAEIWSSPNRNNSMPLYGAMLDTGNFVIQGLNSIIIWQTFKHPRNTILPTQVLDIGDKISSTATENSFSNGKFVVTLEREGLTFRRVDMTTGVHYDSYFRRDNVTQLIFNQSGSLDIKKSDNSTEQLPVQILAETGRFYLRATLDFDGTFTVYSHPRTSYGNENWSILSVTPPNICMMNRDYLGSGPCGYNSYCELDLYGKPSCGCPPGFSLVNRDNKFGGCKQENTNYLQDCSQDGSSIQEDRYDFVSLDGADWPLTDYEKLSPSDEYTCRRSCLQDCYCSVAIFQDPRYNEGTGNCWKKRLPLSNGRLNRTSVDRIALFKILKANISSQPPPNPCPGRKNNTPVIVILSTLLGTSTVFNIVSVATIALAIYFFSQRKLYQRGHVKDEGDMEVYLRSYSYKDLEIATNNFQEQLGHGAFGTVYKGMLPTTSGFNSYIAIKKLDKLLQEGEKEFTSEMNAIGQTHHKNLVRLLGYCDEGEHRLLVYEFMHNRSLSNFLFGTVRLNWQQRVHIASGIARGLVYLHEECSKQIIHCDIKPQNILLDDSFTPKISDFGLAKLLITNQTRTLTGIRGTKGYVAPEWFRNTAVTVKVDVYSFGVVLLEIICCRRCVEIEMDEEAILSDWAYDCYRQGKIHKLVEGDEEAKSDIKRLEKFVMVALWCVQEDPSLRPSMRTAALMLEGILEVPNPPCPFPYNSMSSI